MLDPVVATRLIRREWSRIVATATRIVGDLDRAEDIAGEALLAAIEKWPVDGVPNNPGAWLTTVARNRAINALRRDRRFTGEPPDIEAPANEPDPDALPDDRLALMVMCCHPSLSQTSQVALTLRLAGGLSTREIARAYVTPSATIGQRISRAKATLREQGVRFEVPPPTELASRLGAVVEAIYLVFNEGYASASPGRVRPELVDSAQILAEMLTEVAPTQPEVWGLAALIAFTLSRGGARFGPDGELVPLDEQDRSRWDREAIAKGERFLAGGRGAARGGPSPIGAYMLQAEIAAAHARADAWAETDWHTIERVYELLARATGNPVVELNRAVAISYAHSPADGLEHLRHVDEDGRLEGYAMLQATRADLLRRAGQHAAASEAYADLVESTRDAKERRLYARRLAECRAAADTTVPSKEG